MATEIQKSGISVVGDVHFCHFYETKHDLLDTLVPNFNSLLLVAVSLLAFKYYFVTPLHWLSVTATKIPRLLSFSCVLVSFAVAQPAVEPLRTIRVVVDNAYAPYSFQSDDGKQQGILVDQWQAWEKKRGPRLRSTRWTGGKRCGACAQVTST